jgi:hypothetical protein
MAKAATNARSDRDRWGPDDLAAQDGQPVAEHEDLGALGEGVHPVYPSELDDLVARR